MDNQMENGNRGILSNPDCTNTARGIFPYPDFPYRGRDTFSQNNGRGIFPHPDSQGDGWNTKWSPNHPDSQGDGWNTKWSPNHPDFQGDGWNTKWSPNHPDSQGDGWNTKWSPNHPDSQGDGWNTKWSPNQSRTMDEFISDTSNGRGRTWGYNNGTHMPAGPLIIRDPETTQHISSLYDGQKDFWRGDSIYEIAKGFHLTTQGLVSLRVRSDIRIDITLDQAIRVMTCRGGMIVALSSDGTTSAMINPTGRVYQYGSIAEAATSDRPGPSKFAKIWHRGVSFTSEQRSLAYLVDKAGTRSAADTFSDTHGDFSVPVFLMNAKFGVPAIEYWYRILPTTEYWIASEGSENFVLNGVRIAVTREGIVRLTRSAWKNNLRLGLNGTTSITTPYIHTTASCNSSSSHLFVKRGERRLHYDGSTFVIRNGGQSAGIDEYSQVKIF